MPWSRGFGVLFMLILQKQGIDVSYKQHHQLKKCSLGLNWRVKLFMTLLYPNSLRVYTLLCHLSNRQDSHPDGVGGRQTQSQDLANAQLVVYKILFLS